MGGAGLFQAGAASPAKHAGSHPCRPWGWRLPEKGRLGATKIAAQLACSRNSRSHPVDPGRLSTVALQLHLCAVLVSAEQHAAGYVSDEFLATIADDITVPVLELQLAGLWQRHGSGYVLPASALRHALDQLHHL